MRGDEIRVPPTVWSNPLLEQNRFYIDIGLDLVFLGIAVIPIAILYIRRKSHSADTDLFCLFAAGAWLAFARAYALSVLPSYLVVMINRNAMIGIAVLLISIFYACWRIRKPNGRPRIILGLTASFFVGIVFLIVGTMEADDSRFPARLRCSNNLKQLFLGLQNANTARSIELEKLTSLNAPRVNGGPETSWRVKLLPYIELNHVYQLYEFQSPWDSGANWPIACQKIDPFICPSEPDLTSPKGGRFTVSVQAPWRDLLMLGLADLPTAC